MADSLDGVCSQSPNYQSIVNAGVITPPLGLIAPPQLAPPLSGGHSMPSAAAPMTCAPGKYQVAASSNFSNPAYPQMGPTHGNQSLGLRGAYPDSAARANASARICKPRKFSR